MDRVFDNFLGPRWPSLGLLLRDSDRTPALHPTVDVRESDKEIVVEAELPGLDEKDVEIILRDGVLAIKGEKKSEREEKRDDYHLSERRYGSFQRSFRVPDTVDEDKVTAAFTKGVLKVTLPKRPETVKAERKIPIGGR
jgi:HSP20 family protein